MFDPAMTDRLVHLAMNDSRVFVMPYDESQPFALPQLPMTQLVWLGHLADGFHKRHGRCLCMALMLDVCRRSWAMAEVPTQTCGTDGVRWSWRAEDFENRGPNTLVGGSYQLAVPHSIEEAISLVPPTDGVHIVNAKGEEPFLHAFVHVDGQTLAIDVRKFVFDDVTAALATNAERLTLD